MKRNLYANGSRGFKPFANLTQDEKVLLPINLTNECFAKPSELTSLRSLCNWQVYLNRFGDWRTLGGYDE
ncbi:MAG: hypothetical protein AB1502_17145 [Thermodesulfobacteriota bacterium]